MRSTITALCALGLLIGVDAPKDDPVKAEMKALQGKWTSVVAVAGGRKQWTALAIEGDRLSWFNTVRRDVEGETGKTSVVNFSYTLDTTTKPKEIDLVWLEFANKGKKEQGIYRCDGKTLVLCVAQIGQERPKAFESKEGSGHSLLTLKRAKE